MKNRWLNYLIIILIVFLAIWIDFPIIEDLKQKVFGRDVKPVLGLDLRGGMQVVLQAPEGYPVDQQTLQLAAGILENRSNALGVSEVLFQVAGDKFIVGEFPGLTNTDEVISVIKQTGMLEFVDTGTEPPEPGTAIQTDYGLSTDPVEPSSTTNIDSKVYKTIITGADLDLVSVAAPQNPSDGYSIVFKLKPEGAKAFGEHTKANIGKTVSIVLDKKVVSSPYIRDAIENGEGSISGTYPNIFTYDEANNLRVTLEYGSLPISLDIAESRIIGPTLGQDSLEKSLLAGAIGFLIVSLFMLIYYRLPGFVALIALSIFALVTFAIYLSIPVTLTLPSIAGFILSTGSALDANILQFERLKEELRKGRTLSQAVELGWTRAWSSIRDSNLATLITSAILFWFGSTFGATIVKGFALTLALGVGVSLFTALFVTRTILGLVVKPFEKANRSTWFGI